MRTASPKALHEARIIAAHINAITPPGSGDDSRRFDADETNMLALALEDMRVKAYEAEYPELKGRMLCPVSSDIDTGAESFAYEETDYAGQAKVITNYADDLPTVETKGTKVTHSIISLGDSYIYTIQDMRRAAFSGKPLAARKAQAARRVYERGIDQIAAFGSPDHGIADGLLNKTIGSSAGQIQGTAMTAGNWDDSPVALGMVSDLNKGVAEFVAASKELHAPTTLVLPTLEFLRLSQTYTDDNSPESALSRFLRSNGFVREVIPWDLLKGVDGASGNNSRGLLMSKDPEVFDLVIPQEFEVFAPQPRNLAFVTLCHGRTAGVCVYRPLGLRYLSGLPNA